MNITNVSGTPIRYDDIELMEKVQEVNKEAAASAEALVTTSDPLMPEKTLPVDQAQALEKILSEGQDFRQKVRERLVEALPTEDPEKYVQMAISLKKQLDYLVESITDQDIQAIVKDNYNPEKISIDMMTRIVKENRVAVKTQKTEKITHEIEKGVSEYEKVFENKEFLKSAITALQMGQVEVNKKNIGKINEAVNKAEDIKTISPKAIVHLMKIEGELTVENVYKAKYQVTGKPDNQESLKPLEEQIRTILEGYHMDTEESFQVANLLIQEDIPLTKEALSEYQAIEKDIQDLDPQRVINDAVKNLQLGKPVSQIRIREKDTMEQDPQEIDDFDPMIQKIVQIKPKHIERVVRSQEILNLRNLFKTMENDGVDAGQGVATSEPKEAPLSMDQELKAIKATLQVEEVRLKMTQEAALRLHNKGITIDTQPIEKLVEDLRALEREVYAKHLEYQGVESSAENVKKVEHVMEHVTNLKQVTPSTYASVIKQDIPFTISDMSKRTTSDLAAEYALHSYDTLGTKPRGDLGDRIERTFNQIGPMLKEMGLEVTKFNERAAQILAKNAMPITTENLEKIKLIDMKVTTVTEKLHPSVVVSMIKDQLAPLEMQVDEVLEYIKTFDEKLGETEAEKIHQAIYEMDQNKELSPVERESMIGIYRMFSTISKLKGQAVGFLVKNKLELNMENLFKAAKFIEKTKGQHPALSAEVDDQFGVLKSINPQGKGIESQMDTAFEEMAWIKPENHKPLLKAFEALDIQPTKTEIQKGVFFQATIQRFFEKLSPEGLTRIMKDSTWDEQVPLENNIEKLDQKRSAPDQAGTPSQKMASTIKALARLDVDTLTQLTQLGQNKNVKVLEAVLSLKENPFEWSQKIEKLMKTLQAELPKDLQSSIKDLVPTLKKLADYEGNLDQTKERLKGLENHILGVDFSSKHSIMKDIDDTLHLVDYQKALHKNENYYQIPMMMQGKMTQLNLYYVNPDAKNLHNKEDHTKVYLYFKTENLGKVQAYMDIKGNRLDFSIQSSDPGDLTLLKGFEEAFTKIFKSSQYSVGKLNYGAFEAKSPIGETLQPETVKKQKRSDAVFETTI